MFSCFLPFLVMPQLTLRLFFFFLFVLIARGEDGYRLWLRYDPVADAERRREYLVALTEIVLPTPPPGGEDSRPAMMARDELVTGLRGLLGVAVPVVDKPTRDGALILGLPKDPAISS